MPEFFGMIPMPEPDPEARRRAQEEREKAMLRAHVAHQEVVDFFDGLTAEQMRTVHRLFVDSLDNAEKWNIHWSGYTASLLEQKFGVCACGDDHADDFLKSVTERRDDG